MIPLCRKVFVHINHRSTGNNIYFELFISTLVSPFQTPINLKAPSKPKHILEIQTLNDAKCIAAHCIHQALMVFDAHFRLHTLNKCFVLLWLH